MLSPIRGFNHSLALGAHAAAHGCGKRLLKNMIRSEWQGVSPSTFYGTSKPKVMPAPVAAPRSPPRPLKAVPRYRPSPPRSFAKFMKAARAVRCTVHACLCKRKFTEAGMVAHAEYRRRRPRKFVSNEGRAPGMVWGVRGVPWIA